MLATNVMGICFVVYICSKKYLKNSSELIANEQNFYQMES